MRDGVLSELKRHLLRAQQLMKAKADWHRKDDEFAAGDRVFLKLQPYRQHSVAKRVNEKLSARYFGHFEVLERIGKVAYRLKLAESAKIHDVFHMSQLKRAIGDHLSLPSLPSSLTADMEVLLQPDQVEGVRAGESGREVLIRSKDLSSYEVTWELFDDMARQFPDFHLEDKYWDNQNLHGLLMHRYYTDPSGTFWQCNAKAIGSGSEGADSSLQEQYNKDLTLKEAETIALSILKQVMEEKVTPNNVDIAKVSPTYHLYSPSEVEAVIARL
ncbi:hypothetical protein OROGR_030527 [Orobanche gracilis]